MSYLDELRKLREKEKKTQKIQTESYNEELRGVREASAKALADQTAQNLANMNKASNFANKTMDAMGNMSATGKNYINPVAAYIADRTVMAQRGTVNKKGNEAADIINKSTADYPTRENAKKYVDEPVKNIREDAKKAKTKLDKNLEFNNQFENQEDYDNAFNMIKYGNMNYSQLKDLSKSKDISKNERQWINDYASTRRTSADVQNEINSLKGDIDQTYKDALAGRKNTRFDYPQKITQFTRPAEDSAYNFGGIKDVQNKVSGKQDKIKELEKEKDRLTKKEYYESLPGKSDFKIMSRKGSMMNSNPMNHAQSPVKFNTTNPIDDYMKEKTGENDAFYMSDEEKSIYSYLLKKEGREAADEYRNFIKEDINYRKAGLQYGAMQDDTAMKILSGIPAGLNRFKEGFESLGNDIVGNEALPTSSSQYLSQMAREGLKNVGPKVLGQSLGQAAYDALENTANMAPASIFGAAGIEGAGALGAGTLGLNAGAQSANEAWREGADKSNAMAYGLANGALEGGLEYILGGISAFGGKATGITKNVLKSKTKSALGKALIDTGLGALGEGTEEYLQEIIDPVVRNLTLKEDNEFKFVTEQALYSGLIGALTGGMMEAGGNISNAKIDTAYENIGRSLDEDQINSLVTYASETEELKDIAKEYTENPTELNAGKLKVETDAQIGEAVSDFVRFGDGDNTFYEQDAYIEQIANEAMNDAKDIVSEEKASDTLSKTLDEMSGSATAAMNTAAEGAVVDPTTFKNAFANYYAYGKAGVSFETAENNATYNSELTDSQKKLAYESGLNDRNNEIKENQANVKQKTFAGKGILRFINESETREGIAVPDKIKNMNERQKASISALNKFAELTGQNIVLYSSEAVNGKVTAPNGWYNKDNDTIYLDVNAGDIGENAILRTASHEITHMVKEWSPEKYSQLQDYITKQFEADGSLDAMINEEIKLAKANGKNITYAEALDEVTANSCEMMLKDSESITRMAAEKPDIFEKIKTVIDKIVNDIKKAFEGLSSGSLAHKRMSEILNDWTEIQKMWDDAVVDSAKNAKSVKENVDNVNVEVDNVKAEVLKNDSENEDIRFSLRNEVEESKDLIAVHNLTNDKLKGILELGGLPMPSIAITKKGFPHDNFGNISLVFSKDTIDPQQSASNKVYTRDAWTPTFPRTAYKYVESQISKIADKFGMSRNYLESNAFDGKGTEAIVDTLKHMQEVVKQFVDEKGYEVTPIYETPKTSIKVFDLDGSKEFIIENDINAKELLNDKDLQEEFIKEIESKELRGTSKGILLKEKRREKFVNEIRDWFEADEETKKILESELQKDIDIINGKIKGEETEYTKRQALRETAKEHDKEFTEYLNDIVKDLIESKWIEKSDVDPYTRSGDLKPWRMRYAPYELKNIVDEMKKQPDTGKGFGGGSIKGIAAETLDSIEDIKANKELIQNVSEEEIAQINSDIDSRLYDIASKIKSGDNFMATDYAVESIIDALRKGKTKSKVKALLSEYQDNVTDAVVDEIFTLVDDIKKTPSHYFEAKPKRPVYLDEIKAAVIPEDTSEELKLALSDAGINTIEYIDKNDRIAKLNELNDLYFSYRGDTRSNREILADALMSATKNSAERRSLEAYQKTVGSLDMLEKLRREKRRKLNDVETAEDRAKLEKEIKKIDEKIAYNDKTLLKLEAAAPLRSVVAREAKANADKDIEYIKKRYSENARRKQMTVLRNNIKNNSSNLISTLNKPTNQKHVPESLKKPMTDFLASIDFISAYADPASFNTMQWKAKMDSLQNIMNSNKTSETDEYIDFDPDVIARMQEFSVNNENKKLSDMSYKDLEDLYIIVRSLRMGISNQNKMFANKRDENASRLGYQTVQELSKKADKKTNSKLVESMDKLLNTDMLDSSSYFNMLGENAQSIYKELTDGWNQRTTDIKDAGNYMEKVYKNNNVTSKDLKTWTGNKAKVHTFKFGEKELKLTTGQIMSLYCLKDRKQAVGHLEQGGIRPDTIEEKGKRINQAKTMGMSPVLIDRITSVLTDQQKDVAKAMQSYMANECAKQGNETSMLMYGYKKFNEKNYFPIKVDTNSTDTRKAEGMDNANLRAIVNTGMTKNLVDNAGNALLLRDIFDVYTDHVVDMANYHGLAAPITDALKWYNYKYTTDGEMSSVKTEIERAYGAQYKDYFTNLLKDINGDTNRKIASDIVDKFIGNYKAAAVAGNLRVVVQQPTAYLRAAAVMDPKYLLKGLASKPAIDEAINNSPLAWWKAQGYYDTGLGQSMKSLITDTQSVKDKIVDKSLYLAGKADEVTWGTLWNACKAEIKEENKNLDPESPKFMNKVRARFEDIIYQTQVVDSVFAKSQIMRSKDGKDKALTAFMAEPIKSYNMLRNAVITKDAKTITRAASTFVVTSIATSAFSAVFDAMRSLGYKDDKDKEFEERYLSNFKKNIIDNTNPINLIPYVREISNLIGGTTSNRQEVAWMESIVKSCTEVMKGIEGNSKKTPVEIVKLCAKAISQTTGIPFYNTYRDMEAMYNEIRKDAFGYKSIEVSTEDAVEAITNGDMNTYNAIIEDLKNQGYSTSEINKKLDSARSKLKNANKEPEEPTENKTSSQYKASDITTMLNTGNDADAQTILDDFYNNELIDTPDKVEAFKKTKQKVRAELTKAYKSMEPNERKAFANQLKKLTIAKQFIYSDKDIQNIEKNLNK